MLRSYTFYFSLLCNSENKTKLCETADVTSNLGSDLELLKSIEYEFLTSEVESETELRIQKGDYSEPEGPNTDTDKPLADEN